MFKGDCEDFSVLIMSLCRLKKIDAVFCLGKNLENRNKGHIWIEIPICSRNEYNKKLEERIKNNLSSKITTLTRNDTVWLSFLEKHAQDNYELEYIVDSKGILRKIK